MKLETQLFNECQSLNLHCCIAWQRINEYSVEIYKGYVSNYQKVFYTDGSTSREVVMRRALKFLKTYE